MKSGVAAKLKEAQQKRIADAAEAKNRALFKARYLQEQEAKKIAAKEAEEWKKAHAAEEAARIAHENKLKDIEEKTHKYYHINMYNRKKPVDGMPMYFGETEKVHNRFKDSAWRPQGYGEMHYDGSIQFEGQFERGKLQGKGLHKFSDSSSYVGEFRGGNMDGIGVVALKDGRQNVIMRDNVVICVREDLTVGKQVEFDDASLKIYSNTSAQTDPTFEYSPKKIIKTKTGGPTSGGHHASNRSKSTAIAVVHTSLLPTNGVNKLKATVLKHIYGWRYLFRFDNEIYPRQREIDLSRIAYFKVLHHMPLIYHLDNYTDSLGGCSGEPVVPMDASGRKRTPVETGRKHTVATRADDSDSDGNSTGRSGSGSNSRQKQQQKLECQSSKRYNALDISAPMEITNYNSSRNYKSNSKVDTGISYDYFADTYGVISKPNMTESMHWTTLTNSEVNNRDNAKSRGSVRLEDHSMRETSINSNVAGFDFAPSITLNSNSEDIPSIGNTLAYTGLSCSNGFDPYAITAGGGYYDSTGNLSSAQYANHASSMRLQSMSGAIRKTLAQQIVGVEPLKPCMRYTSDYKENIFETRAIGIGAAEEVEMERRRAELKKKQWEALIEDRKKRMEAERQEKIREQQAAMMKDSIQEQQARAQQKMEEEQAYQAELQKKMDEATAKLDY